MASVSQAASPCSRACGWTAGRRRPAAARPATFVACRPQQQQRQQRLQQPGASSALASSRAALAAWRTAAVAEGSEAPGSAPLVAVEGDIVTLNWKCFSEEGELLESSDQNEEPTTFEVGAGDIVGNRLFEAFDEAVRGLAVGDFTRIQAEGGEWKQELMFKVPRGHPEIERLEGRYKNQGGLREGLLVELSNGGMALVVKADDEAVILDANNMLAGKKLWFELELAAIDRAGR
ncbi:hypothetical protein ABPG75_008255 [Micractinium tetrahymenae]